MSKHDYHEREDELLHCKVCGGAEGALPTECPGRRMTNEEEAAVWVGTSDFSNGAWKSTRRLGPFTWTRRDNGGDECWNLVQDQSLRMTVWSLKNYGGPPGRGFSGWKLVSGGPFDDAGAWATRDEAMQGVVPFLLEWYRKELRERIAAADQLRAALGKLDERLKETS